MSHLTVKSFLQPDQHILSTRENSSRIKKKGERERKAKEAEGAEAARKKHEVEQKKKHTPLAKVSEQESSIREKLSGVEQLLKDGKLN